MGNVRPTPVGRILLETMQSIIIITHILIIDDQKFCQKKIHFAQEQKLQSCTRYHCIHMLLFMLYHWSILFLPFLLQVSQANTTSHPQLLLLRGLFFLWGLKSFPEGLENCNDRFRPLRGGGVRGNPLTDETRCFGFPIPPF